MKNRSRSMVRKFQGRKSRNKEEGINNRRKLQRDGSVMKNSAKTSKQTHLRHRNNKITYVSPMQS
jgi:hypothetical protein